MGLFSCNLDDELKMFWTMKEYQKIENSSNKKKLEIVQLGGNDHRKTKIKVLSKLKPQVSSPIKIFTSLRDSYMNMMLGLAGNGGVLKGESALSAKRIPKCRSRKESSKEFESRLLFEICKSIAASKKVNDLEA